ncbi:MAG: hypothetical protein ACLGI3_00345 [Actinomycetes bacterium]
MWLALLLGFAVLLGAVALITGAWFLVIPMVLALIAGAATLFATGGGNEGTAGPGEDVSTRAAHPEDTAGGGVHQSTGHAHGGQANMTP